MLIKFPAKSAAKIVAHAPEMAKLTFVMDVRRIINEMIHVITKQVRQKMNQSDAVEVPFSNISPRCVIPQTMATTINIADKQMVPQELG